MPLRKKQVSFPKNDSTYFSLCSKLPPNDSNCKYHKSSTLHPTKNREQVRSHKNSVQTTDSPSTSKTTKIPTQNCQKHFNNKSFSINGVDQSLKSSKLHRKKASHGNTGFALPNDCDEENHKENKFKCPTDCKYCHDNLNEKLKEKGTQKSIPHTDCKYCSNNLPNKPAKKVLPHTDCKYCKKSTNNREEECRSSADDDEDDTMNSIFSEEILCDELSELDLANECTCIACQLHDPYCIHEVDPHHSQYHYLRYKKPASSKNVCNICKNPSACLVNEDFPNAYANIMRKQLNCSHSFRDTWQSTKSRSYCEFCLQNGQSAVIYNSHQYRNTFGIITCPLIRNEGCLGCDESHGFPHDQMMSAFNSKSVPYHGFISSIANGCNPHSFTTRRNSYSDEPLETPYYSHGLRPNYLTGGNLNFYNNYPNDDLMNERFYNSISASYVPNKYEFQNLHPDPNNTYPIHQRGSYDYEDNCFPSEHMRNPKKNTSCPFCLSSDESPLIYNSHKLKDEAGISLRCPILQQTNGVTGSNAHASNSYGNNLDKVLHGPFVKGISNGSLNKRQYANYLHCLI